MVKICAVLRRVLHCLVVLNFYVVVIMTYKPVVASPTLSEEEIACFSELFSSKQAGREPLVNHVLTVSTEIPQAVASILGQAKLTLLAEVSHYRLWFPLVMKLDELGQLTPTLGIPEVVDVRGAERSWRLSQVTGLQVFDRSQSLEMTVLSLSSSGITVQSATASDAKKLLSTQTLQLQLPNGTLVHLDVEPVRTEGNISVLKIHTAGAEREALRQFLFNRHRKQYAHLYKNLL